MNTYCGNSYGDGRIKSVTQVYHGDRGRDDCGAVTLNELFVPRITYEVVLDLDGHDYNQLNKALEYMDGWPIIEPDPGRMTRYRLKHR